MCRRLPFDDAELVLLGQHHVDVAFNVRILLDQLAPDALLDRGLQLLHTGDAFLLVESGGKCVPWKSINQYCRFSRK